MKSFIVLLAAILVAIADTDLEKFQKFKETYERQYLDQDEENNRFYIFQQNLRKIEDHNAKYDTGETSYYMGMTSFTDISPKEFLSMLNYSKSSRLPSPYQVTSLNEISNSDVPTSRDWTQEGVLTEVKDQGYCGSCWAFSATGALEAAHAIKTGSKIFLSEQNLMDCSSLYGNSGCDGGVVESAYKYVRDYGIETGEEYPYAGRTDLCQFLPSRSVLKLKTYYTLERGNEDVLKKVVGTVGPVTVGMNANYLQFYAGGIFYEPNCDRISNHGMLVVGYGLSQDTPYWILKNSWGPSWGEKGYLRMVRSKQNQCGIADGATFPVLV